MDDTFIPRNQMTSLRKQAVLYEETRAVTDRQLDTIESLLGDGLRQVKSLVLDGLSSSRPERIRHAGNQLLEADGKYVRPTLCLLAASAIGLPIDQATPLAAATELIHSATLLHDDVMDEGEMRRGRPAARVVWGNLISVLAGDALLTRALRLVSKLESSMVMDSVFDTLERLIDGEVYQMEARNKNDLGVEGYLRIAQGKTASLFGFTAKSPALLSGADSNVVKSLSEFGENLGISFQVIDDILDLEGSPSDVGKQLQADFAQGKTTLPIAFALSMSTGEIQALLNEARLDGAAASALAQHPAVIEGCKWAREFAVELTDKGLAALKNLPTSDARDVLTNLSEELTKRRL